ncbi:Protein BFR2 [Diplonema papillatum]|nr:Protein BFR2 [Diplonema papillatum]
MARKRGGFAAEMEDLLSSQAPKELHLDGDDGQNVLDEDEAWKDEVAALVTGEPQGLRMRGELDGTFKSGAYKGRVVPGEKAFERGDDPAADESEAEEDSEPEEESMEESMEEDGEELEEVSEPEGEPAPQQPKKARLSKTPQPTISIGDGVGYDEDVVSDDDPFPVVRPNGAVDEAAISAKMDDIFAGLDELDDMEDTDAPGETFEAFAERQKEKAGRRLKKKAFKRKREDFAGDDDDLQSDGEEDDVVAKQLAAIRQANQQASTEVVKVLADDDAKSAAARNQYHIWGKLVACRIHLQQPVSWATRMPPSYASEYHEDPEISASLRQTSRALADLLDTFHELRTTCVAQNPSVRSANALPIPKLESRRTSDGGPNVDKYWRLCVSSYSTVRDRVMRMLDQWHEKANLQTAQVTQTTLKETMSAVSQVESTLRRDKQRLVAKTRKVRSGRLPYGHPMYEQVVANPKLLHTPELLQNADIFDDSDFYSWLLTDYIHNCADSTVSESAAELADAQRLAKDPGRLLIDKKRSKARKLSFEPHAKLIDFKVPVPQDVPSMVDALYATLFASA